MELVRSVSGVRGIFGRTLNHETAACYVAAFVQHCRARKLVVGRDARESGPALTKVVLEALRLAGVTALDLGLCATPAVQIAVEETAADGGLVLTASHNPAQWNGLKFISAAGTFLGPGDVEAVFAGADRGGVQAASTPGSLASENRAIEWQVRRAIELAEVRDADIAGASLRVVVDGCSSVGGPSTVMGMRQAGVEVVELDCEPDGDFKRDLEPLPANLGELGRRVRESNAHFGIAHDPDGDRAALVDEKGVPMGEEFTLAIAVERTLGRRPGPVVVNLSTSRMCEDLAARFGVPFFRSRVGEINVVEMMKACEAVIGGEGNGGVIAPDAHYGRDGTVAALLVASQLAVSGEPLSHVRRRLGRYTMAKEKVENAHWDRVRPALLKAFAGAGLDETDGLRFAWPGEWLHVRPSGTEPIVRFIAEAESPERAAQLCARARKSAGLSA
jgi:phosphomannomutase